MAIVRYKNVPIIPFHVRSHEHGLFANRIIDRLGLFAKKFAVVPEYCGVDKPVGHAGWLSGRRLFFKDWGSPDLVDTRGEVPWVVLV